MSYLCDLFFLSVFIFIIVNRIISRIQTHLLLFFFYNMPYYFWMKNVNNFQIIKIQPQGDASACFFVNCSLALLMKEVLLKSV